MRVNIAHQAIILLVLLLSSCIRRPLDEPTWGKARIPVSIDWLSAGLDPDNDPEQDVYSASIWLFPKDGSKAMQFRLPDPRGGFIDVPVGEYDVIVMNNTIREYSAISFEGTERFDTFCAKAVAETDNPYISRGSDELFIKAPELLATWSTTGLTITPQMVNYSNEVAGRVVDTMTELTNITPHRLVYTLNVMVHVKRISSAKSATGIIRGMASGCYLASGKVIPPQAGQVFILNNRKYYEGQMIDGTVEARLHTFGPLSDMHTGDYTLQTDFVLRDDSKFESTLHNISDHVTNTRPQDGELHIDVEIGIEKEEEIQLPNVSNGGMDVNLGDWEEEEDIPLEI